MTPKLTLGEDWFADLPIGEGNGLYYGDQEIIPLGLDHYEIYFDGEPAEIYLSLKGAVDADKYAHASWEACKVRILEILDRYAAADIVGRSLLDPDARKEIESL